MKDTFGSREFNAWLAEHDFTLRQLSETLDYSISTLAHYKIEGSVIPIRFKYALDGVLAERIRKAEKGLSKL